jgi:hypothetical protein
MLAEKRFEESGERATATIRDYESQIHALKEENASKTAIMLDLRSNMISYETEIAHWKSIAGTGSVKPGTAELEDRIAE